MIRNLAVVALAACTTPVTNEIAERHQHVTSDDVVIAWNKIAVDTITAQAPPVAPFPSTRIMGLVQVAVFEAVNAISDKYEPYLGTIDAPAGASTQAAAIAAAHKALVGLFPSSTATLDAHRATSLAALPDGQAKTDGIAVGEAAAAAMLADRMGDGSAPPQFFQPTSSAPYEYQLTGAGCPPGGAAFFHWRNVKPFGIESSAQFRAPAPPPLDSGRYTRDFNEVKRLGAADPNPFRPQDRADVARFYHAQPPHRGWNMVARQLVETRNDDISDTSRTLAMMNLSLSDAHITVFESKYHYRTWRPVTAIRRADEDGNRRTQQDPTWTPYITTPCFPGYPSAHAVGAGAASRVLKRAYGAHDHELVLTDPGAPGITLYYHDLREIVEDVSDARVYGGIHFRHDQDVGEKQGKEVASYNLENLLQRIDD